MSLPNKHFAPTRSGWSCECGKRCDVHLTIVNQVYRAQLQAVNRACTVAVSCPYFDKILNPPIGAIDGFVLFEKPLRFRRDS